MFPSFTREEFSANTAEYHAQVGLWAVVVLAAVGVASFAVPLLQQAQGRTAPYRLKVEYGEKSWHDVSDRVTGLLLAVPWFWTAFIYFMGPFMDVSKVRVHVRLCFTVCCCGFRCRLCTHSAQPPNPTQPNPPSCST